MILAIDIGNTNIVLGFFDKLGKITNTYRLPTDRNNTEHGYAIKIKNIFDLEGISANEIEGSIISSTVPEINVYVSNAIEALIKVKPKIIGMGLKSGITVNGLSTDTKGADLIATAAAVKELYKLPAFIVDMGTATTVTALSKEGEFLGGAILPGVRISNDALSSRASLLPTIELKTPDTSISLDTITCLQSGIIYGNAGAVDRLIDNFVDELGYKPTSIVATGGISEVVIPNCKHDILLDKNLLLKGLYIIYNMNI